MNRRQVLAMGGVGGAAALAGLGWALRRPSLSDPGFWGRRFETPGGGELAMSSLRGRRLLLNFWATWCPPCVREMPALDRFHQRWSPQGWTVLGLAVDQAAPVQAFLRQTPVSFPVALAGFAGVQLSRQLGNSVGALPFSVVFDVDGSIVRQHHGETSDELLQSWARTLQ